MMYDPVIERFEGKRKAFLQFIEEDLRGHFGGIVHNVVKKLFPDGTKPGELLPLVFMRLGENWLLALLKKDHALAARFQGFFAAIRDHYPEALGYMEWAIWWRDLDETVKVEVKEQRRNELTMEQLDPTGEQLNYLRRLGHVGDVTSMAHAHKLIEQYIAANAYRLG